MGTKRKGGGGEGEDARGREGGSKEGEGRTIRTAGAVGGAEGMREGRRAGGRVRGKREVEGGTSILGWGEEGFRESYERKKLMIRLHDASVVLNTRKRRSLLPIVKWMSGSRADAK